MATAGRKDKSHRRTFKEAVSAYVKPPAPADYVPDAKPEYGWKADRQPMDLPNFGSHVAVNKALVPAYVALMADILITAGYATPAQKTELVRGMLDATGYELDKRGQPSAKKNEFNLPGVTFRWRVKSTESCETKVITSMAEGKYKTPQNTGDYFACKLVGKTMQDVVRLRNAARHIDHAMSSLKCEYSHPSAEGFRSHKSHHEVGSRVRVRDIPEDYRATICRLYPPTGGFISLTAKGELMITDQASENIEQFTHALKAAEDHLRKATLHFSVASVAGSATMPKRVHDLADAIRRVRVFCNDAVHNASGMDALAYTGKERGVPVAPEDATDRTRDIVFKTRSSIPKELRAPLEGLYGRSLVAAKAAQGAEVQQAYH